MNPHQVTFADLADWVDGRLDEETRRHVEAHLAIGCPRCEGDLRFLRRVTAAARPGAMVEPPDAWVAQAEALYRARRPAWGHSGRIAYRAVGLAAALMLILALILSQQPLLAQGAYVAAAEGTVEIKEGGAWRPLAPGDAVYEGDRLRIRGASASIVLFDGSRIDLHSGAELTFIALRAGLLGTSRRVALAQHNGSATYAVPRYQGQRSAFKVQSPAAHVSADDTRFVLEIKNEAETVVRVFEGQVHIVRARERTRLGPQEEAVIRPGESFSPWLAPTPIDAPSQGTLSAVPPESPAIPAHTATPEPPATVADRDGASPRGAKSTATPTELALPTLSSVVVPTLPPAVSPESTLSRSIERTATPKVSGPTQPPRAPQRTSVSDQGTGGAVATPALATVTHAARPIATHPAAFATPMPGSQAPGQRPEHLTPIASPTLDSAAPPRELSRPFPEPTSQTWPSAPISERQFRP